MQDADTLLLQVRQGNLSAHHFTYEGNM